MLTSYVDSLKRYLEAALPADLSWLKWICFKFVDLMAMPVIPGSRFYWPLILASLAIAFATFIFIGSTRGHRLGEFIRYCFPREYFTHPSTIVDYELLIGNHLLGTTFFIFWRINTAFIVSGIIGVLTSSLGPAPHIFSWTLFTLLGFAVAQSLIIDLGWFLYHWAAHRIPLLWAFHKLHHSAQVLTPFVFTRTHPVEQAISRPVVAATTALLMGPVIYLFVGEASPITILGLDVCGMIFAVLGHMLHHSHIWVYFGPVIGRVIHSPAQHQIHHSVATEHWDRNFAEYWAIWDWIFGTLYLPKERLDIQFGLAPGMAYTHNGLLAAYLNPFAEAFVEGKRLIGRMDWVVGTRMRHLAQKWRMPASRRPIG